MIRLVIFCPLAKKPVDDTLSLSFSARDCFSITGSLAKKPKKRAKFMAATEVTRLSFFFSDSSEPRCTEKSALAALYIDASFIIQAGESDFSFGRPCGPEKERGGGGTEKERKQRERE